MNIAKHIIFPLLVALLAYTVGYQQRQHKDLEHRFRVLNLSLEVNRLAAENLALMNALETAQNDTTGRQQAALGALCYVQAAANNYAQ